MAVYMQRPVWFQIIFSSGRICNTCDRRILMNNYILCYIDFWSPEYCCNAFRMEVLFWGLRELKSRPLCSVKKPEVSVECAGIALHSTTIADVKWHPNFENPLQCLDLVSTATYFLSFDNLKILAGHECNRATFRNIQNF
jgi:hypothetical protein